jgi:hypothetical protein
MVHKSGRTYKIAQSVIVIFLLMLSHVSYTVYFQLPIDINYSRSDVAQQPQISINNQDNVMAIWAETTSGSTWVIARSYNIGSWGGVGILNSSVLESAYSPQVVINNNGFGIAVWVEDTSAAIPGANVNARRYDSVLQRWVPVGPLNADVLTSSTSQAFTGGAPQVGVDDNNNGIAIWQELNPVTLQMNIYSRSTTGTSGPWVPALGSPANNLNSVATNFAESPRLAMNGAGQAMAVWVEDDNIYARYYNGSSWGTATALTSVTASVPQVAINANGQVQAIWTENNTIYQNYFNGTGWGSATLLAGATSAEPQIAINVNDHAMAAWVENNNIYASYYDGTTWNAAVNINNDTSLTGSLPHISMDDANNAIVAWVEQNIIYARYFNGIIWSPAFVMNSSSANAATSPQVAVNANGSAIIAWAEENLSNNNIYASTVLPIKFNQRLALNSVDNCLVAWQQTSDYYATNLSVQTTSPVILTQGGTKNTTLPSGASSGIFMDAAGNAWTFVLNGSVLTKFTHAATDPVNQWTATVITTTASTWTADVNLSGDIISGYTDIDGNVYVSYNSSTTLLASSACMVQAAVSTGFTNVALAFQGNCLPQRRSSSGSSDITVLVYDAATDSWTLSPTLASGAIDPQVKVDSNYNVTVIWQYNYDGTHYQIQAARGILTNQAVWDWSTPIVNLTADTNNADASLPQLAMDGSGNAIAIWEYYDNTITNTVIQAAYYVYGQTWTNAMTLSPTDLSASKATISMDNIGNAIVAWIIPYFNGTNTVTRVQCTYFNTTTKTWQAISPTAAPDITSYISPEDKFASAVCASLGANGIGLISYTLSDSAMPPNALYGNIVQPAKGSIQGIQNLNQPAGTYDSINCSFNSTNLLGVVSNDSNAFTDNTHITLSANQAFSYGLVQWCSAFNGTQQYIAAVNASMPIIDWYVFDPTVTPSLTYIQSLVLTNQTINIQNIAVYNKSDNELYLAIVTQNSIQIKLWNGSSFISKGILDTTSSGTVTCVSWWVDSLNVNYVAYLATADVNNNVTIYGLDENFEFNFIDSQKIGSAPITSLLWYVQSDTSGSITMLDLVGGSINNTTVYAINVGLNTKMINNVTPNVRSYPMSGLSTCNGYLAIGDYGVPQGIGAAISLYSVSSSGTIGQVSSVITDTQAINVYYLAKCCTGSPQYLLAGIGNGTAATLCVYKADLSSLIAKQQVGSLVDSVSWSPTGVNVYLGATYQDDQSNSAGKLYKLDITQVPYLVDLGTISY